MILGLLALCVVVMLAFPKTATARWLHSVLVERPLEWLANLKRRDVILLFVMVVLFVTAGEFLAVFGAAELLALGVNLSLYVDAVLVTTAATIGAAVATAWSGVRARLFAWRRPQRARAARQHRTRKPRKPASLDDDGAAHWAGSYAF